MNIPQISNIDTALRIFYQYPEIGAREIMELFATCSKSTVNRLKRLAQNRMVEDDVYSHSLYKVHTGSAYKAWSIDPNIYSLSIFGLNVFLNFWEYYFLCLLRNES